MVTIPVIDEMDHSAIWRATTTIFAMALSIAWMGLVLYYQHALARFLHCGKFARFTISMLAIFIFHAVTHTLLFSWKLYSTLAMYSNIFIDNTILVTLLHVVTGVLPLVYFAYGFKAQSRHSSTSSV